MPRTIAITGASGLIGRSLADHLAARGDIVVRLVRRVPHSPVEREWDPAREWIDPASLADVDTVVNLAGAGVGDRRWTTSHREAILTSRVSGTRTLVSGILAAGRPIALVNGSAVGYYGDRGEEILTEESPAGLGFLSEVVRAWESATGPLADAGLAVSMARTGLVLAADGGALAPLLRLARLGLGGPIGSGRMFWPVISLADEVAALTFLIDRPEITGPVNVVGIEPVRQRDLMATLGAQLHRPAVLPAPKFAVRAVIGEFAGEITASQRVLPERLLDAGFEHQHPTAGAAVTAALAARHG